jgi:hypothetical protein
MSPAERLDEALTRCMMAVALEEARHGLSEGGIPIGAAVSTVSSVVPRSRSAS